MVFSQQTEDLLEAAFATRDKALASKAELGKLMRALEDAQVAMAAQNKLAMAHSAEHEAAKKRASQAVQAELDSPPPPPPPAPPPAKKVGK